MLTYLETGDMFEGLWENGMRNGKGRYGCLSMRRFIITIPHTYTIHHRYIYGNGDIYEGILKDDQYLEDGQFLAQEL